MNNQPEALRLAEKLEKLRFDFKTPYLAATELRRLHEVNQELIGALGTAEESLGAFVSDHGWSARDMDIFDNVSAIFAKHKNALAKAGVSNA